MNRVGADVEAQKEVGVIGVEIKLIPFDCI